MVFLLIRSVSNWTQILIGFTWVILPHLMKIIRLNLIIWSKRQKKLVANKISKNPREKIMTKLR